MHSNENLHKSIGIVKRNLCVSDCIYPWTWMVVDVRGNVKPCYWTDESIGNIHVEKDSVWNNSTVQDLRRQIVSNQVHSICRKSNCPYMDGHRKRQAKKKTENPNDLNEIRDDSFPVQNGNTYLFNELQYLKDYSDVKTAVQEGVVKSGHEHYRIWGEHEGRQVTYSTYKVDKDFIERFDDDWYLDEYADIKRVMNIGEISCPFEHFFLNGRFEKRRFRLSKKKRELNNFKKSIIEFLNQQAVINSVPTIITTDVTTRCNIECVMCPKAYQRDEKTESLSENVFDYFRPFLKKDVRIQITGQGEPLMGPLFWRILRESKIYPNIYIRLNSNGLLWNETNIDLILDSDLAEVSFSIDSAHAETYRKLRGANFSKLVENIRLLIEKKRAINTDKPLIYLNMTLMRENIEEIVAFIELAGRIGVDHVRVWHLDPFPDQKNWILNKGDWQFNYQEQMLSNYPELSNKHIVAAKTRANELNIDLSFLNDRDVIFT